MDDKKENNLYRDILIKGISKNISRNEKISEILSVILSKFDKLTSDKSSN